MSREGHSARKDAHLNTYLNVAIFYQSSQLCFSTEKKKGNKSNQLEMLEGPFHRDCIVP